MLQTQLQYYTTTIRSYGYDFFLYKAQIEPHNLNVFMLFLELNDIDIHELESYTMYY